MYGEGEVHAALEEALKDSREQNGPTSWGCSQSSWWNSIVSKFLRCYWAIDNQILQASLERGGKVGTALLIPIWFVLTPVPLNRASMLQKASRARRDHLGVA